MLFGKERGHLMQIAVGQARQQVRHRTVLPPSVAEIQQLVIEVVLRFAGQPGVVAVGPRPALRAVAGRTGGDARGHGVRLQDLRGAWLSQRRCRHKGNSCGGKPPGDCPKPRQ
ncbi:hypothetical protein D3C72_1644230 [compost metagenome]